MRSSPMAVVEISRSGLSAEHRLHFVHHLGQLRHRDRTLLARLDQPFQNLWPVELFAPSISFDDHVGHFVTTFVRSKAPLALQALPPPPDDVPFLTLPGIDHPILPMGAKGQVMRSFPFDGQSIDLANDASICRFLNRFAAQTSYELPECILEHNSMTTLDDLRTCYDCFSS